MNGFPEFRLRLKGRYALLLTLGGCGSGEADPAALYVERLAYALDRAVLVQAETLPRYPQRRVLRVPVPRVEIDVTQFARLHACDLGALIGERNSALGRVQTDSQRLRYELDWIERAGRCGDAAPPWLAELRTRKIALVPAVLWNATFASAEIASAMGAAGKHSAEATPALRALADQMFQVTDASRLGDLEPVLKDLADHARIGSRRQHWAQIRAHLSAVTAALKQRHPPVCLNDRPTPRSRHVARVFVRYFVDGWRAEITQALHSDRQWMLALQRAVEAAGDVAPPAFATFYQATLAPESVDSEWHRTQLAIKSHAQAWQGFLNQCGMVVTELRELEQL